MEETRHAEERRRFERLYQKFAPRVEAVLRRKVYSAEERQDLLQEIFHQILLGLDAYRGEGTVSSWVFAIAYRRLQRWREKQPGGRRALDTQDLRRDYDSEASLDRAIGGRRRARSPEQSMLAKESRRLLYEAIQGLPPQERRCTIMRLSQEASVKEIATALRLAEGTVQAHLHHARSKLRRRLHHHFSSIDF